MKKSYITPTLILLTLTLLSGLALASTSVSADDVVDDVTITVPMSCTMTGTGQDSHTASINPGTYNSSIGLTTIKAFCNDNEGFSIYAIGYTDEEDGKNVLTSSTLGSTSDIATSTATSGNNSAWAMKLAVPQSPTPTYPMTIQSDTEGSFSSFHTVPDDYTLVAKRTSSTDIGQNAEGSSLTTTYQAYISQTQPAGTYTGKVKYTMVHPHDADAPIANPATLDTGQTVNAKLKSLAATVVNGVDTTITPSFYPDDDNEWTDTYIKSIVVHTKTPAPSGFIPTEKNTISTSTSNKPVYIVFDNTNNAGVMHFYTEGGQIVLPTDSSYMFYLLTRLADLTTLSSWDTSNTTDMSYMFYNVGITTSFTLDLSSWDTSNVTDMSNMFSYVGYASTTFSPNISSWNTSKVTNMRGMFFATGDYVTTFTLDLSSWDTSKVTDMHGMFNRAGTSATTWSIGDLSSWDMSKVTDMGYMFNSAGYSTTTWSIGDISSWNTSSVTLMNSMFYNTGYSATTFTLNLASWNTSNVTDMSNMFSGTGYSATTWSIGDISSWNTSSVTLMNSMFSNAGYSATTFTLNLASWNTSSVTLMGGMFSNAGRSASSWSVTIPPTNGNNISNTTSRLYGQTTSIYGAPPSGKSFTLAQP